MKYIFFVFSMFLLHTEEIVAQVQPDHTVIVVLENRAFKKIYNSPLAPYINSLLSDPHTALFTKSFALTHPSQPNYIMLFSGSNQGVTDNTVPTGLPFMTPNLGASLLQNGFGFMGYSESLPSVGYTGAASGSYTRSHNPWVNWQGNGINGIPSTLNVPFTYFPTDFNLLPSLSFVIPNKLNDMHDGGATLSISNGDTWLQNNMAAYIEWCKSNNSLFILTFDEDDGSQGNQILTFITGENVRGGSYDQRITHYNLLRTIEDLYKLPYAGASADSSVIRNIWIQKEFCKNGDGMITSALSGSEYKWQLNTGSGFIDINDNFYYSGTNTSELQLNNVPTSFYGYEYRCVVDGNNSNSVTLKFTNYWNGSANTAWENSLNWSCGLPDINTDVIINKGSVVLNSDVNVRSLKVKQGVQVTVSSGKILTVTH